MDKPKAIRFGIEIGIFFNTTKIISKNKAIATQKSMELRIDLGNKDEFDSGHPPINQGFRLLDQLQDILGNATSLCHDRRAGLGHNLLSGHLNGFSCKLHVFNSDT